MMRDGSDSALISLAKMAKRVGVTAGWLREQAEIGNVPGLQAGSRWLFDAEAVTQKLADMAKGVQYSTKVTGHQTFKNGLLVDVVEGGDA